MIRLIAIFLLLVLTVSGCTQNPAEPSKLIGWLAEANLDAEETPEQLYAAALLEDTIIVYSTSMRVMDVARSFEAQYPGLTVTVEHLREPDLYAQLAENYERGSFTCDVIISSDGRGIMTYEFLPKHIVVKYVPYDIRDKILPGNNEDLLMLAGEASVFSYNELYYDRPPINNWWELTEEKWRGMVYMPSPIRSVTTLALFITIIERSDIMAQAYEDLYGVPLELPAGENAGREFIRRLMENDAVIVNSSDETAEEIGMPGSRSPNIGIVISSKTRLRDIGYEIVNHYGMELFCGVYIPNSVMMAGGSRNTNGAKLFIRWLLGEADGQGEGYQPYLQSGAWSVRSDVSDDTGVRSDELNLLRLDRTYLYENQQSFHDFWEELMKNRQ